MPNYDQACIACDWKGAITCEPFVNPPCPRCGKSTERVWERSASVAGDDIPGGMVVENGFDHPIRVYSHSEHRRLLAARGLEIKAKWAGPNDKHLSRWDAPDQTTLDNAKALVSRTKADRWKGADHAITRETGETFTA